MVNSLGKSKSLREVLEERGINTKEMKKDDMIGELKKFDDFKNEKSRVERELLRLGHKVMFLPKFHPELNPIE